MPLPAPVTIVAPGPSAPTSGAGLARAWASGHVLLARVVETGPGGAALLQIGGQRVHARAQMPLSPGQEIRLQVQDGGPPAVLRLVPHGAPGEDALAARLLRAALPQQRPVGDSLAALARLSEGPPAAEGGRLPEPARGMLSDLLASLPRPRDAGDAARLQAMVRASGLFYEAEQARSRSGASGDGATGAARQAAAGADLKARITAVARALDQGAGEGSGSGSAPQAQDALRGALARIETHQVLSARASGEHGALWRMDLPLSDERGPHDVEVRIRRDGARGGDAVAAPASWVVELMVEPPGAVPVHARVTLAGGAVHTLLTTEDGDTFHRLRDAGPELERRLREVCPTVGGVTCRHAPLPADEDALALGERMGGLLRVQA